MAVSREDIRQWFKEGKKKGATHMIVVCDEFDWEEYPIYVSKGQSAKGIYNEYNNKSMQKVMEVYSLKQNMEKQLAEHRAFHFD